MIHVRPAIKEKAPLRPQTPRRFQANSPRLFHIPTYLNCGELFVDARDARAERPGSCGSEALWWSVEFCVEVDEGREMGSIMGSDCRASS